MPEMFNPTTSSTIADIPKIISLREGDLRPYARTGRDVRLHAADRSLLLAG